MSGEREGEQSSPAAFSDEHPGRGGDGGSGRGGGRCYGGRGRSSGGMPWPAPVSGDRRVGEGTGGVGAAAGTATVGGGGAVVACPGQRPLG